MVENTLALSANVQAAFASFLTDNSVLALPLTVKDGMLQTLPLVRWTDPEVSFQVALNELDAVIDARTPLYLLLRRNDRLIAITFVPYLANEKQRSFLLENREGLVKMLGKKHFSQTLICKEVGEITDARSWTEREDHDPMVGTAFKHTEDGNKCNNVDCENCLVKDVGYKRNRCRLCDRRMKNKIASEALDGFILLKNPGAMVQVYVDTSTDILSLKFSKPEVQPDIISDLLPTATPSFTFYHHPNTSMLYFIFHSPDAATVQQRMKHTMAIPGLLVHAEDAGIRVDQKIEIHDPEDLEFRDSKDERVGRFRSMYRREGFNGTELVYEGMTRDKEFLDAL